MSTDRPVLLTAQHVSWEASHRILDACGELEVRTVEPLAGDPLPSHEDVAPETSVLHWHGDVFDLPCGAEQLASSVMTEHQAFRLGNAWGVLFHAEADVALVEALPAEPQLRARSTLGFEAFAATLD